MTHPAVLLRQLEARARRSLGQNFLCDGNVARRIVEVAAVGEGTPVLEVGPGLGGLTSALLAVGARVVAVEKDPTLAAFLRENQPSVEIHEGDALETDLPALCPGPGWSCIANLPYNVATPLVLRMITMPGTFTRLVLMVQREVAERFVAAPGTEAYGSLSLEILIHARARIALRVGPGAFHPRPRVDSAVVLFEPRAEPWTDGVAVEDFRKIVRAAFGQRRKTVRNALGAVIGRDEAAAVLEAAGVDPLARAEELGRETFVAITRAWRLGTT